MGKVKIRSNHSKTLQPETKIVTEVIEKIVEKQLDPVIIEKKVLSTVEVPIEKIVEKIVEVPVERVEVKEVVVEKLVNLDRYVSEVSDLRAEIKSLQLQLDSNKKEHDLLLIEQRDSLHEKLNDVILTTDYKMSVLLEDLAKLRTINKGLVISICILTAILLGAYLF